MKKKRSIKNHPLLAEEDLDLLPIYAPKGKCDSDLTKGEKLIMQNAVDYITGKHDGRLIYRKKHHQRMKEKCPKCGKRKVDLVSGLGGLGVGQMYVCQDKDCQWRGFNLIKL